MPLPLLPGEVVPVARRRGGIVVASLAVPPCRPSSRGAGKSTAPRTAAAARGAPVASADGTVAGIVPPVFGVVAQGGCLENKERTVFVLLFAGLGAGSSVGSITIGGHHLGEGRAGGGELNHKVSADSSSAARRECVMTRLSLNRVWYECCWLWALQGETGFHLPTSLTWFVRALSTRQVPHLTD